MLNHDNLSSFILIDRGILQGSPLAPYLYILVAEKLMNIIESSPYIERVNIGLGQQTVDVLQFADDSQVITKMSVLSINAIFVYAVIAVIIVDTGVVVVVAIRLYCCFSVTFRQLRISYHLVL